MIQGPVNKTIRFHVLTLFPGMFASPFQEGVISRAVMNGRIKIETIDIRDHSSDSHRTVDDYAFGGGPGMVMKPGPLFRGVERIKSSFEIDDVPVLLMSPRGRRLTQQRVEELSAYDELILICGRYEGIDERVRENLATDEISVGEFRGYSVPEILLSGNHFEIKRWRRNEMLRTTFNNRPDLLEAIELSEDDTDFLNGLTKP